MTSHSVDDLHEFHIHGGIIISMIQQITMFMTCMKATFSLWYYHTVTWPVALLMISSLSTASLQYQHSQPHCSLFPLSQHEET